MAKPPEKPEGVTKPRNWIESLNCAIEGIIYAFKTQRHIRYHYITAFVALSLGLFFKLPLVEFAIFVIAVVVLLAAEMFNTALEETVNLVEERHHLTAKNAKDVSAGAVLVSSLAVVFMAYVIFFRYFYEGAAIVLRDVKTFSAHIGAVALLMVMIATIALKAYSGKGRPFKGGLPSGHAAVSFSMWTTVTLLTLNPFVSVTTFIMAAMISYSRLFAGVHTRLEVALGGLLGSGLTLIVFYVFSVVFK